MLKTSYNGVHILDYMAENFCDKEVEASCTKGALLLQPETN
jgi:hypothetical protein